VSVNIVLPIAGLGSRFTDMGYTKAKPFVDVNGYPMISQVLRNLSYPDANYILLVRKEHLEQEKELFTALGKELCLSTVAIDRVTEGAVCTVLYAHKLINNDDQLIVANSDQIIDEKFSDFVDHCLSSGDDGVIMTFRDETMNPKWSFAEVDKEGSVLQVKEKVPISDYATVGIYMFKKGKYFVDAALDMIIRNERVNNEFYVCPVYNYMIKSNKSVTIYNILASSMHGLGTPEDLDAYLSLNNFVT